MVNFDKGFIEINCEDLKVENFLKIGSFAWVCLASKVVSTNYTLAQIDGSIQKELVPISKTAYQYYGMCSQETRVSMPTSPIFDSLAHIKVPALIFNWVEPCGWY